MSKVNKQQNLKPNKLFVKTGDTVKVLSGDDKGKIGKIIAVDSKKRMIKVEGVAIKTKHIKKNAQTGEAGSIIKTESFIHSCKVKAVEPKKQQKEKK